MIAELFQEEDLAREMARRLIRLAQQSSDAVSAEREGLLSFLRGPMERHIRYEESVIFPRFERHGLAEEVQVARKHHAALREAADALEQTPPDGAIASIVVNIARLLLHHTNFEGDYIYPELTVDAWRDLMKETAHDSACGRPETSTGMFPTT